MILFDSDTKVSVLLCGCNENNTVSVQEIRHSGCFSAERGILEEAHCRGG